MIKTKKLMVLVLAIAIVAVLAGGCVEKNIESYRMTETELLEGITERDLKIVEPGDPRFPAVYSSVERIMSISYGSTRARGSMEFSVIECTTKEDAQQLFKKLESEAQFRHSGPSRAEGRIDDRFIIVVSWYGPDFPEEDALWIFNNAG